MIRFSSLITNIMSNSFMLRPQQLQHLQLGRSFTNTSGTKSVTSQILQEDVAEEMPSRTLQIHKVEEL